MVTAMRMAVVVAAIVISACSPQGTAERLESPNSAPILAAPLDQRPVSDTARLPPTGLRDEPAGPRIEMIDGAVPPRARPPARPASPEVGSDDEITLNFINADIREVAKTVLGDYLQANYIIDPKVQGTVTLRTSRPLPVTALFPAFEEALKLSGAALVGGQDYYKVVPLAEAPRQLGSPLVMPVGFGVEVIPLRHVDVQEMQRLLEPIVPAGASVRPDRSRNTLLIVGSEGDREAMREHIATFDVDWLAGMSFALITPHYVDAKQLAQELELVIGGREGGLAGMVKVIPLQRLNSVLAVSRQREYLRQLAEWTERLDRRPAGNSARVFVYFVQNGRATQLAAVLTKMLTGIQKDPRGTATRSDAAPPESDPRPMASSTAAQASLPPTSATAAAVATTAGDGIRLGGMAGVTITADEANNALVIYATPAEYAAIEEALRKLDIPPLQVLLEAAVAEVTLTDNLRYGVQYSIATGNHQVILSETRSAAVGPNLPGFAYIFSTGNRIQAILSALEGLTEVNVVSSPKVMVLNHQTATLQVGDQVPVATQSAVSVQNPDAPVVNSIQYKDTGVILKVTPRVNEGGLVVLEVSQEISDVTQTTTSTLNSPTIQQRKIISTVAVQDGESIALGGLIRDSRRNGKSGIPGLQSIPVLGPLFGTTTREEGRTELLVLITPRVVQGQVSARAVTDELRRQLRGVDGLLR